MIADDIVLYANNLAAAGITEIQVNNGWKPNSKFPTFESDMRAIGWYVSAEWCAFSAIYVYKKCLLTAVWAYFSKLQSGNAQQMLRNCHNDVFWPTGNMPIIGCMVVWGLGNDTTAGHVGICIWVLGMQFKTAEGNTSSPDQPDIRTGWTYAIHAHIVGMPHSINGLNYLRSIYPVETLPQNQ